MSFSFDFVVPEEEGNEHSIAEGRAAQSSGSATTETVTQSVTQSRDHWKPFHWMDNIQELLEERKEQQIVYDEIALTVSLVSDVLMEGISANEQGLNDDADSTSRDFIRRVDLASSSLHDCTSEQADIESNDLIPGVYEGGLKVWESSLDLVRYMHQDKHSALPELFLSSSPSTRDHKLKFLELGCGHGLPACYVLREVARLGLLDHTEVILTDYNDYVLKDASLSNIVLNMADFDLEASNLAKSVRLGAGDWFGLLRKHDELADEVTSLALSIDWIAATETLYTVQACQETAWLISQLLRPETGEAWVASKRYYFGVGGGVDAFRIAADSITVPVPGSHVPHKLQIETVRVYDTGNANIRELLRVRLKSVVESVSTS